MLLARPMASSTAGSLDIPFRASPMDGLSHVLNEGVGQLGIPDLAALERAIGAIDLVQHGPGLGGLERGRSTRCPAIREALRLERAESDLGERPKRAGSAPAL